MVIENVRVDADGTRYGIESRKSWIGWSGHYTMDGYGGFTLMSCPESWRPTRRGLERCLRRIIAADK